MAIIYIYGLVDPRNNTIFYVGFTNNPIKRFNSHLNITGKKREKNLYKDNVINKILKIGLKPKMKIIDECEHIFNQEVNMFEYQRLEIYYIKKFKDEGIKLTNLTNGGDTGPIILKEVFQYSESGKFLKKYDSLLDMAKHYNVNYNSMSRAVDQRRLKTYRSTYLFSSQEKAKNFKFVTALKHTTPILQYSLDGKFICEYSSQADAYRKTNILQSGINVCLKKRCKQFGNYYWFYKNEVPAVIEKYQGRYSTMVKPILQYDLNDNLIAEYKSISDATRCLDISSGWIVCNLKNNAKSCKGFVFKYKNE